MPILFLTGANGALGSAIRDCFLEKGWQVAGFVRSEQSDGESESYRTYRSYAADLTDETSLVEAFELASQELGRPNAVIATVGGVRGWKPIAETNLEDFKYLLELNTVTGFLSLKHGLKLLEHGGALITVGAEPALKPGPNRGAYASSKAALVNLTLTAAEEGKAKGIRANCIVPHTIDTPANREWGSPEEIAKWTDPRDIAELCYYLCSDMGKAVTGSVIRVPNRM